jgi:hypothetical protein
MSITVETWEGGVEDAAFDRVWGMGEGPEDLYPGF